MSMRIYTASKTQHAAKWKELKRLGYNIISTWINEAGPGETSDFTDLWVRCIEEATYADALLVYREPGEVLKGAFVETGAALANKTPVFAIGLDDQSFCSHPLVTICDSVNDALVKMGAVGDLLARMDANIIRASGDCICQRCRKTYLEHTMDQTILSSIDKQPFLHILCDGTRVKL